jgi:hypothetical protein
LRHSALDHSSQLIFTHMFDDDSDPPPTGPLWELDGLCWMGRIQGSVENTGGGPCLRWSRRRLPKPLELAMYARFQDKQRFIGVAEWRMEYRRLIADTHPLPTISEVAEHLSLPLVSAPH